MHAHLLGKPGSWALASLQEEGRGICSQPRVCDPHAQAALPSVPRWKGGFSFLEEKPVPLPFISLTAHPLVQGISLLFLKQASGLVPGPGFKPSFLCCPTSFLSRPLLAKLIAFEVEPSVIAVHCHIKENPHLKESSCLSYRAEKGREDSAVRSGCYLDGELELLVLPL